jgi:proteasome accessory factor C
MLGSLTDEGDAISPEVLTDRLGVDPQDASLLIYLLLTASSDSDVQLPLFEEDGDVGLLWAGGARGRALRLTMGETFALESALDEVGVPADDETRRTLERSLAPTALDLEAVVDEVERTLAPLGHPSVATTLSTCSKALVQGKALDFSYQGTADREARRRHVMPRGLRRQDDSWFVDGVDTDSGLSRTFRTDRMTDVRLDATARADASVGADIQTPATPTVTLRFSDESYLETLDWPGLVVTGRGTHGLTATMPDFGGEWLPRHVAACSGTVTTDDAGLATRVRAVARDALTRGSAASRR